MYQDILEAIYTMVKANTSFTVVIGSNPTKESIAVTGFSTADVANLDRDSLQTYDITINGKSGDQQAILSELSHIHRKLTLRKDFPHSNSWQIYTIDTSASPRLIGVEEAERTKFIYGSSITVKFYALGMKGDTT